MIRRISTAIMLVAALVVAGCATGPKFSTIHQTLPSLAPDQGRIYFYRQAIFFGDGLQPSIKLNGEVVGNSVPGGVFFKDVKPGSYVVATATEVERRLSFTLAAGQNRYVKTSVSIGILVGRVIPELVDPEVGRSAIQGLSYTGGTTGGSGS